MTIVQQRPLRGSRISSFYPVKNLPSLASLDSAFQLQEYISLLIRLDVHDVESIVSLPGKGTGKDKDKEKDKEGRNDITDGSEEKTAEDKDGEKDRKADVAVDEACWIYEQLRRLAQDLSHPLITMLQQECTRASCPEMKAGEWLYLCVAHGNDGAMEQCCAIDYILHTVDSATALLNSPRTFPSRLQIPHTSHRHFSALARRLGRIFAHAYFHHREAFEQAEVESSLYARFLALTSKYDLVPSEFLVIPQRIAHGDSDERSRELDVQPPRLFAAAVDPLGHGDTGHRTQEEDSLNNGQWDRRGSVVGPSERAKSHSPPGLGNGSESPRKFGRNRTDTMVFSEVPSIVEDLARAEEEAEKALDMGVEAGMAEDALPDVTEISGLSTILASSTPALPLLDTSELHRPASPSSPPKTAKPLLEEQQITDSEEEPSPPQNQEITMTPSDPPEGPSILALEEKAELVLTSDDITDTTTTAPEHAEPANLEETPAETLSTPEDDISTIPDKNIPELETPALISADIELLSDPTPVADNTNTEPTGAEADVHASASIPEDVSESAISSETPDFSGTDLDASPAPSNIKLDDAPTDPPTAEVAEKDLETTATEASPESVDSKSSTAPPAETVEAVSTEENEKIPEEAVDNTPEDPSPLGGETTSES